MTLREKLALAIRDAAARQPPKGSTWDQAAADAILAAIKAHMTSPEAVGRAVAKFYAHNDRFDQAMNAAILAALEGEP